MSDTDGNKMSDIDGNKISDTDGNKMSDTDGNKMSDTDGNKMSDMLTVITMFELLTNRRLYLIFTSNAAQGHIDHQDFSSTLQKQIFEKM